MTWEHHIFGLFDDLEQQAAAAFDLERSLDVWDRGRAEYQQVTLASRLMASVSTEVGLDIRGVGSLRGRVTRMGTGWLLLRGPVQDWVVALPAVLSVTGSSERSAPEVAWSPLARLGLGSALRRLAESGARCVLHRVDGHRSECLVRRVGQDFVEVDVGAGRVELVAFSAIAVVQSPDQE